MKTTTLLSLALMAGVASSQAADVSLSFEETFAGVATATPIDTLPGWHLHYGKGAAPLVLTAAGWRGPGVRFNGNASFNRILHDADPTAGRIARPTVRPGAQPADAFEFRIKLRVMADTDYYVIPQILLGKDGGVHGLGVRFNGGTKDGWEDNTVQVSTGGANWGSAIFQEVPSSRWRKGVWYEITVTGLAATADGSESTVRLRITEAGVDGKPLVDDAPVAFIGGAGFKSPDLVIIGNAGAGSVFDVDDLALRETRR
jgi:hypothetical protein